MADNYCPACYPKKVRSHWRTYYAELFEIIAGGILFSREKQFQLPRFSRWLSLDHFWHRLMEILGVVSFTDKFEKKDHYPRSWIMIEEAQRRGLSIEAVRIGGRVATYYRVKFGNKYYYYDALPSRVLNFNLDDKTHVKKQLLKQGFPAPEGKTFWSAIKAIHYGKQLGFPLAVKPARGTHAYHVTAPVLNEAELIKAVRLAKQYQPRFIVERFLPRNLYRVTVINFKEVFVAQRRAPNVIGDGSRTTQQLIEEKNANSQRGEPGQKDSTLHKIPFNEKTEMALRKLGLSLSHVPREGEEIILHNKLSISSGGDIIEETPLLHPENREMFRRAARLFGTDLIGFDLIAEDISKPYTEQSCGIIEANSIPMIDFHQNPSHGQPQPVAAALWNGVLADKRVRYLIPTAMPRRSFFVRAFWHFLDVVVPTTRDFLYSFRLVRLLDKRQLFPVGWLKPGISPETAIAHLKMNGFEVMRPGWIDRGEMTGLRKLIDHRRQCHIRFFEDGEVCAHLEYAPEARPFSHLLNWGFHNAQKMVEKALDGLIEVKKKKTRRVF